MLGPNLLANPNFQNWSGVPLNDTPDGWAIGNQDGVTNYVTEESPGMRFVTGAGVNLTAVQSVLTPGIEYAYTIRIAEIDTAGIWLIGPQQQQYSTGVFTVQFTATGGGVGVGSSPATFALIESISVREVIPMGRFTIVLKDNDNDKQQFSLWTADMNVGNIAAQLAAHTALSDAIAAVCLGVRSRIDAVAVVTDNEPIAAPNAPGAQTHIQWLVRYVDDVNSREFTLRMGTADLNDQLLRQANSTVWDPTAAEWVTFVAAFEAVVLSEDGNAVTVQQVELLE